MTPSSPLPSGRPGASLESLLAAVVSSFERTPDSLQLLVVPSEADAERAASELSSLLGARAKPGLHVHLPGFVQAGVFRYESAKRVIARRLGALQHVLAGRARIVVASAVGFARVVPSPAWLARSRIELAIGKEIEQDDLLERLEALGYHTVQRVEEMGEFAVRGSIIDLWTPGERHPVRLELFGDALEKIRAFRASDQRSFETREEVCILPSREFTWPKGAALATAVDRLNAATLSQHIGGRARADLLENLQQGVPFAGVDDAHTLWAERGDLLTLVEFCSAVAEKRGLSFEAALAGSGAAFDRQREEALALYRNASNTASGKNQLVPRLPDVFPLWAPDATPPPAALPTDFALPNALAARLAPLAKSRFSERAQTLSALVADGLAAGLLFFAETGETFGELAGLLAKYVPAFGELPADFAPPAFDPRGLAPAATAAAAAAEGVVAEVPFARVGSSPAFVALGRLEEPFFLPASRLLAVPEGWLRGVAHDSSEVFTGGDSEAAEGSSQAAVRASREAAETLMQAQFGDFSEGDLVVHVQHGIARFKGLMTVRILDITGDFLALEYAGGDKIYVPVHKFNLVQKYVGASRDDNGVLDSLKGGSWEKKRQKAKADAEKLAKELLEHQARRAMTPGHAFGRVNEDYVSFCAAFPYDETPDQLKATHEIIADMARPKAMDRLLVGDVGFGKTEVAFRAAFRCILDGKQVAWLVPTTVLAHQHFRSALERFKGFGAEIEVLDRAVGNAAQNKITQRVRKGEIDLIIGTHRLLSKDIAFRDLGLLVVDEEQRFGVLQKEKIKNMSYGVDVLTMTATPIPRTLQMAMMGLRDLSLLTTPPKARLAVKTFVCPFDEGIVRDAITQELSRGGQVFYVHNRVEELGTIEGYLKALVPNARICVGHGKMSQKELDATIIRFLEGQFDLLLCTTIIESGIDMPGVNTILVQNADMFGLAQLYQLRGRVGRRSTRGYAYFLTSATMQEEDEGASRLGILQDHQDLGSGFVIASHDMEMRGGGSVLGDDQSGRASEVGLETYTQMLDDAIRQLGGQKVSVSREVEIQLPLHAQIPEDYVENARERLKVYRRFFGARTEEALRSLLEECEDRFGPLPESVKNLSELARVRRRLVKINALSLTVGDDATELRLSQDVLQAREADDAAEQLFKRILDVCNRHMKGVRLTPDGRILLALRKRAFSPPNTESALRELKRFLSLLAGEAHEDT